MSIGDINTGMVLFLRDLANSVESEKITPDQLKRIGEFYMSYQFCENTDKDDDDNFSGQEFLKFLFLGWYVYRNILNR